MAISIHHLDISTALFAIAARAVEQRSIEMAVFASINDVVQHAAERAVAADVSRQQVENALAIEVDGPIRISLIARAPWRPTLQAVQARFSEVSGRRLSVKQTVAVLLQLTVWSASQARAAE